MSKLGSFASSAGSPAASRWEARSVNRVLAVGHPQILERSRRIVEAAYELLEEQGLEGLTIRAVLNKTRLSRRAFYERFAGKDDLVLAVFEHTLQMAAEHFAEQVDVLDDPMERLKHIIYWVVLGRSALAADEALEQGNRRGAALSREHLRLAEARPAELQAALSPLLSLIARQLAEGMEAGVVRQGDPQRLAALVYNLVSTTVHTELLTDEHAQPDREHRAALAGDIWEFCRRALTA